jgi:hypothetical protein
MKSACLVCAVLAVAIFTAADDALYQCAAANQVIYQAGQGNRTTRPTTVADAAPVASPRPEPVVEQEAADKFQREGIRLEIETNINRLKRCVANRRCLANGFPKLLLGLTRSEVEGILGPPQYHLQLGANDLYYWTVPLNTSGTVSAVRVQVIYGDCYYREKNSRTKAVCEVTPY